ncbi:type 1 glutamine amidotransferase domain-containing protein [Solihabitans fulvus]|uniref:Type 1 glutamine amidotransferase domain-containing protein n=1 Tax=Solihabitans fulvus TaxID=1892852 RepID=A0A5B2XC93_9PSEU|nr:type 1 glutamine amidotransferase domain-containing protein [Solihabitans fulvus]KAA2260651.1 type 1 glutamine amidotransferase domain-containing protein [Solihabitans fulvus]
MEQPRALIALSSTRELPDGRRCGYWLPEAAYPWWALTKAGWQVDFVSTKDGEPPVDGVDHSDPRQHRFLLDGHARRALAATRRARHYDPGDYRIITFAGGRGAMWDLPHDHELAELTAGIYRAGGVVGAVCHGTAGLLNVRVDGVALVSGRNVTGFSEEEERTVGLVAEIPFFLGDELAARGAHYLCGPPLREHIVTDERLVTGQNPASAPRAADELLAAATKTVGASSVP